MTIIEMLKQILTQGPMKSEGWSQTQREALMDLLLLGIYVDGKMSIQETDLLGKETQKLTEETGIDWDMYVANTLHDIHKLEGNPERRYHIVQNIRGRLEDIDKRQRAVQELKRLLSIDGRVPVEQTCLEEVMALFKIRPIPGEHE